MSNQITVRISAGLSPEFRQAMQSAGIAFEELGKKGQAAAESLSFGDRLGAEVTAISGRFAGIGLALMGVQQVASLVGGTIRAALNPAAEMQSLEVSFGVLLGSMTAAKTRMEDLTQFANTTPFELPEVARASRTLETLTKGALATGAGLRLVGDVAAGTGQPFDELATWIGRLYDGLQSGRPVGEALARLQELGVVSGDVRGRIEELQKEGKKGPEVWNVAAEALGRFGGMMEVQSQTLDGLTSTMRDQFTDTLRGLGNQILPTASDTTKNLTAALADLKPAFQAIGWIVAGVGKLLNVAMLGFRAFADLFALIAAQLLKEVARIVGNMAAGAEEIVGFFGRFLPEGMLSGFQSSLASARDWARDMERYFQEVSDNSSAHMDGLADAMIQNFIPEEIQIPASKKGKGGGGGGGGGTTGVGAASGTLQDQFDASFRGGGSSKLGAMVPITTADGQTVYVTPDELRKMEAQGAALTAELARDRAQGASLQESGREKAAETVAARFQQTLALAQSFSGRLETVLNAGIAPINEMWGRMANRATNAFSRMGVAFGQMLTQMSIQFAARAGMFLLFAGLTGGLGGSFAKATGGIWKFAGASFDTGTMRVPRDGLAMIHQDEAIMPKNIAEPWRQGKLSLGGDGRSAKGVWVDLDAETMASLDRNGSAVLRILAGHGANFA